MPCVTRGIAYLNRPICISPILSHRLNDHIAARADLAAEETCINLLAGYLQLYS